MSVFLKQADQSQSLIEDLKIGLDAYIKKFETKSFKHGFWFFKKPRSINREANFLLAKQLLIRLNNNESVDNVFANLQGQRNHILANAMNLNRSDILKYWSSAIHSADLKKVIRKAKAYIKQANDETPGVKPKRK